MKETYDLEADLMDGLVFTIGREGHIQIDDNTVSKKHAEIKIIQGKIYLRDLNSTNGTYLYLDKKLIRFREGFIKLDTPLLIGSKISTAKKFLEIIGISIPLGPKGQCSEPQTKEKFRHGDTERTNLASVQK